MPVIKIFSILSPIALSILLKRVPFSPTKDCPALSSSAFGIPSTIKILELKLDQRHWPVIKPFLIFLRYIKNTEYTEYSMDDLVVETLRKI